MWIVHLFSINKLMVFVSFSIIIFQSFSPYLSVFHYILNQIHFIEVLIEDSERSNEFHELSSHITYIVLLLNWNSYGISKQVLVLYVIHDYHLQFKRSRNNKWVKSNLSTLRTARCIRLEEGKQMSPYYY